MVTKKKEDKKDMRSSKAYKFIVGFIIAVALIIFIISSVILVIKIVPDTFGLVAATFQSVKEEAPVETADISADKTSIKSGDGINFSWGNLNEDTAYSLIFLCGDDSMEIRANGQTLSCDEYIVINNNDNNENVVFVTDKDSVNVSTIFESEDSTGDIETIKQIDLTVSNNNTSVTTETVRTTNVSTTPNTRDLYIRLVRSGVVNNTAYIQFEVGNSGSISTGTWQFRAILPTASVSDRVFVSNIQTSLSSGSGIIYTLTFSNLESGTNQAIIQIDPQNIVSESNESNNQLALNFRGNGDTSYNSDDRADFNIDLLGYGILIGNRYTETRDIDQNDELAIRFRVRNIGGEETEDWR
ncbi:MAG: hypothetical protein MRY49_02970, partial [Candidatus Pacebacteria bacterium]|nr:hypothetical protein [Candidatus Paceibacterota bacterium]